MAAAMELTNAIADWVGHQRWFVGKGMSPHLECVASIALHSDPLVEVRILIVADRSEIREVLYNVPVVLRRVSPEAPGLGFIATIEDGARGVWHIYDGPEDPAFTDRLRNMIAGEECAGDDESNARGESVSPWPATATRSRVLRGEQSNTSIVYSPSDDRADASSVICKIFRMLHHGENPDVVLQSALFTAGSRSVPPIFGSVIAEWPNKSHTGTSQPGTSHLGGSSRGHLAFAQHFISGAGDAWGLALAAGLSLSDFTVSARQIGIATADVHATLASVLPTRDAAESDIRAITAAWRSRLGAAIAEVPDLAPLRPSIELLYERAATVPWPRLQSIHGDLHLGQILETPGGSWVIIDFEGEPLRPLAERSLPDLPLRDIAGMLRSFDYAAGSQTPSTNVTEWAHECRAAFLDGYIAGSGRDIRKNRVLLDAFELDKALYEVVYEARNRPTWMSIPTNAVRRITDRVEGARGE